MGKPFKVLGDEARGVTIIRRHLQSKKVLIVLDDVDNLDQLKVLAIEKSWFGLGSRVIITTRDSHLLSTFGVDGVYNVDLLSDDEAFDLLALKAFKQKQPQEEFFKLSKLVVAHAQGLPLAVSTLGSHLYGRSVNEWESAIERLQNVSPKEILDVLQISFDGLEDVDKEIFLDIACFLKGMDKERVINILNGCGFNGHIGISSLIDRSIITILENKVEMHDNFGRLGKKLVCQESPRNHGKCSRLWIPHAILHTMEGFNEGDDETTESIFLELPSNKVVRWNTKAFSKYRRLRLLKINGVEVVEGPTYLSKELRYLEWHKYPSKTLPSSFDPCNLVELDLSYSKIERLWYGNKDAPCLRILNLSYCDKLIETPEFDAAPNIERLELQYCEKLMELHPSFQNLIKLVHLNLSSCSNLIKFPNITQDMPRLHEVFLNETKLESLPYSIRHLIGLVSLELYGCHNLQSLPPSIVFLKPLKKLNLRYCIKLNKLPENLQKLDLLEELVVNGTAIPQLPASVFALKNLKILRFQGNGALYRRVNPVLSFSSLCSLTELELSYYNLGERSLLDIGCLSKLTHLDLRENNFVTLPASINQLSALQNLYLNNCLKLEALLDIPSNIEEVKMIGCISLKEIPDPMKLCNLKRSSFQCFNCVKLHESKQGNYAAFVMLQRYLQGFPNPRSLFEIMIPGSKIPEWFTYRGQGSSIIIPMPADLLSRKFMGVAACVSFRTKATRSLAITCTIRTRDSDVQSTRTSFFTYDRAACDHFWSFYLSAEKLFENEKGGHFNELKFIFDYSFICVQTKGCGARLVTFEDVEELESTIYLQPQIETEEDLIIDPFAVRDLERNARGNRKNLFASLSTSDVIKDDPFALLPKSRRGEVVCTDFPFKKDLPLYTSPKSLDIKEVYLKQFYSPIRPRHKQNLKRNVCVEKKPSKEKDLLGVSASTILDLKLDRRKFYM